ncbi:MAG: hypothetical protein M3454_08475 [Actinomycetota bacterium]|nr:hypothetical protein [Actinomycetota bacterium]
MSAAPCPAEPCTELGDLVLVLLAGTLQGLSDRLQSDGYDDAAEVVSDLVEVVDDYLDRVRIRASR